MHFPLMRPLYMLLQILPRLESLWAFITREHFSFGFLGPFAYFLMTPIAGIIEETPIAILAIMRLTIQMRVHMPFEVRPRVEILVAYLTVELLRRLVLVLIMMSQPGASAERRRACIAEEILIAVMQLLVCLQILAVHEQLRAAIA